MLLTSSPTAVAQQGLLVSSRAGEVADGLPAYILQAGASAPQQAAQPPLPASG